MSSPVVTTKEGLLPLPSLRLLVPPLQLLSASMRQILKQKDVMSYRKVSEFVSFVMEAVPELLLFKHWTQLKLGLKFILELCRRGEDQQLILSHLENMKPQQPTLHKELSEEEKAGDGFIELIHALLKNNEERQIFFQEVWCEEYVPHFDSDLQMLFWEFLCRLHQLLPVPNLEQTVFWLGEGSVLDDFPQCISDTANVKNLLHHHKQLGHLEQHVPPSSMGDHILSSILAASQSRPSRLEPKCNSETESDPLPNSQEKLQPTSRAGEAAMEIFTVTECAEIELTSSATDVEVVVIDNTTPNSPTAEQTVTVLPEDVVNDVKENDAMVENNGSVILKDEPSATASSDIEVVFVDDITSNDKIGEETVITLPEYVVRDVKTSGAMEDNGLAILKVESLATASSDIGVMFIDNTTSNDEIGEETVIALSEDVVSKVKETKAMKSGSAILKDESQVTASSEIEIVFIDNQTCNDVIGEETAMALPGDVNHVKDSDATEEDNASAILKDEPQAADRKRTSGPHDCPDCDKKFKFASFLVAHRVIHTGERPHKCSECGQCFSFRQSLERHRQTHKTGKSFGCPVCHERFPSSAARSVHKHTHAKEGVYDCEQCGEKFTQELALARHVKTHLSVSGNAEIVEVNGEREVVLTQENVEEKATEPEEEQGKKANSEFKISANRVIDAQLMNKVISLVQVRTSRRKRKATKNLRSLQKKLESQKEAEKGKNGVTKPEQPMKSSDQSYGKTMTSSKNVPKGGMTKVASSHSCPHCDYCHLEEDQVQQHISDSHPDRPGTDKKQTTETPTGETEGHKTQCNFKCLVCGQLFKSLTDRKDHISGTHMRNGVYFCSQCDKNFTWRGGFIRHVRMYCSVGGANCFSCHRCELAFDCASALYSHVQTHQEERVHVCNCGKSFAYKAALTSHERTHQKERPHVCQQCGKGFLYKGSLLGHMKIHSQEMPFTCSHCGKGFKRERNMKKHERCHTREDVFKCSQCDKSFVYKATLTRHELTHTGERPYLCSDCGKGFFSHAELLKHERFHTGKKPFECPHCGKKFTQSCYLTVHLRYHTGAKPYACSECEKSFLSANRLKRHQRTHTGEKPYVCEECGKGFRQSYHLKLHQRTHVIDLT